MKKSTRKLTLHRETLRHLSLKDQKRIVGGTEEDHRDQDDGTGGSITCSVPFCQTFYPNEC